MNTLNYTGLPIAIIDAKGTLIRTINPAGHAKIESASVNLFDFSQEKNRSTGGRVPLYKAYEVKGLPEAQDGVRIIVTKEIQQRALHRRDLVIPNIRAQNERFMVCDQFLAA